MAIGNRWFRIFTAFITGLFWSIPLNYVWGAATPADQIPIIRGPLFISAIFPVLELKHERIELIEPIPDAYSFWGKMILSMSTQKAYFPAPFSYPYRFSKLGLAAFQQDLKKSKAVESSSVQVRSFPNIPTEQHYLYEPSELKQILIKEAYLSFRLREWSDIEFMAFPTFVVLAMDYTKSKISSSRDYEDLKSRFAAIVEHFQSMERLRIILGVSRKTQRSANIPILTFTAIESYVENVMDKIYLNGPIEQNAARRISPARFGTRFFKGPRCYRSGRNAMSRNRT